MRSFLSESAVSAPNCDALKQVLMPCDTQPGHPWLRIHCPDCNAVVEYYTVNDLPQHSVTCLCGGHIIRYTNNKDV